MDSPILFPLSAAMMDSLHPKSNPWRLLSFILLIATAVSALVSVYYSQLSDLPLSSYFSETSSASRRLGASRVGLDASRGRGISLSCVEVNGRSTTIREQHYQFHLTDDELAFRTPDIRRLLEFRDAWVYDISDGLSLSTLVAASHDIAVINVQKHGPSSSKLCTNRPSTLAAVTDSTLHDNLALLAGQDSSLFSISSNLLHVSLQGPMLPTLQEHLSLLVTSGNVVTVWLEVLSSNPTDDTLASIQLLQDNDFLLWDGQDFVKSARKLMEWERNESNVVNLWFARTTPGASV